MASMEMVQENDINQQEEWLPDNTEISFGPSLEQIYVAGPKARELIEYTISDQYDLDGDQITAAVADWHSKKFADNLYALSVLQGRRKNWLLYHAEVFAEQEILRLKYFNIKTMAEGRIDLWIQTLSTRTLSLEYLDKTDNACVRRLASLAFNLQAKCPEGEVAADLVERYVCNNDDGKTTLTENQYLIYYGRDEIKHIKTVQLL